jgi:transcriptional regulator with XRE-family HTH domain
MMEPNREELRAWLLNILKQTRETPTALARRAGVAQSTLTRFLNNDDAPMLGLRSISKIAHAAGVPPIGVPAKDAPAINVGLTEGDGQPFAAPQRSKMARAIDALIDGQSAVDPWIIRSRALEDAGLLPGDIAIVSLNALPRPSDVVCAQFYRWSEGKAETLFRIYEPPYIIAASRDLDLRRPLLIDNDRVVIKGVVTAVLRIRA